MELDKNSWHVKAFKYWYTNKYGDDVEPGGTNLCPYVRVVLLWSWMRFFFWPKSDTRKIIVWSFLCVLINVYLFTKHLHDIFIPMWCVLTMFSVVGFFIWVILEGKERLKPKEGSKVAGFLSVVKAKSRSVHDGICPIIWFK